MKKVIPILGLLLAGVTLFYSCKKENSSSLLSGDSQMKVSRWLDSQKVAGKDHQNANVDLVKENLNFAKSWKEKLNDQQNLLVIPLNNGYRVEKKIEDGTLPYLLLTLDQSDKILRANIVLYMPENDKIVSELPRNSFSKLYNSPKLDINGTLRILKVTGAMLYQYGIKNGKINSRGTLDKRSATNNKEAKTICIDWYLITRYYDESGAFINQTEEYITTTCSCVPDGKPVSVILDSCDDDGGGGGTSGNSIYEYDVVSTWNWNLYNNIIKINSNEKVKGRKVQTEPQGGHFTDIQHLSSFIVGEISYYGWTETLHSVSASDQTANSHITGKIASWGSDPKTVDSQSSTSFSSIGW